jgi:leucyl-tRNA---protein transferase
MRLPLRLPLTRPTPEEFDAMLEQGDRRSGPVFYRPQCPSCLACEAIRVCVPRFVPTRSQRRAWKRNEGIVRVEIAPLALTDRHLDLYNRHKTQRSLAQNDEPTSEDGYRFFLHESCVDSREVRYLLDGELIAVSVLDFGRSSVSSVYHYFDPEHSSRSLGVYSVLKEIEICRALGVNWYYLGLYVEDCRHLNYKACYFPHQRRIDGQWQEFSGP